MTLPDEYEDYVVFVHNIGAAFLSEPAANSDHVALSRKWREGLFGWLNSDSSSPEVQGSALIFLHELNSYGSFFGTTPRKDLCASITLIKENILRFHQQTSLSLCETLIKEAPKKKKHVHRRYALDQSLKRLLRLEKESFDQDQKFRDKVALALAKAYYLRGKLIRPKGFSLPAKKIETLEIAEDILAGLVEDDKSGDALRLRAMVHIDFASLFDRNNQGGTDTNFLEILDKAVSTISDAENCGREDILILLARAEEEAEWAKKDGKFLLEKLKNNPNSSALDLARVLHIFREDNEAVKSARRAIEEMARVSKPLPFSHEDWCHLVRLLSQLWRKAAAGISETILLAWRKVCHLEPQTNNVLHVRWYWSRQRDLYDLAFHAAGTNLQTKAQIADSLKARPALHLGQARDLGLAVEQMEMGLLDRYIPGLGQMGTSLTEENNESDKVPASWPELPQPWIAVHFYLSNGFGILNDGGTQNFGYALIYDSKKTGREAWSQEKFNYSPIWAAYITWQENYQGLKEAAAPDLKRLCENMGHAMPFLFNEKLFPEDRPVIVVPHDFMHRLPLHAAIKKSPEANVLFGASHQILFLPGMWTATCDENEPVKTAGKPAALIHWNDSEDIKNIVKEEGGTAVLDATRDDWNKLVKNQEADPKILYCHGEANAANPFASSLKLDKGGLRLREILDGPPLAGRFILGACETDLVVPASATLDEHFSISSALLLKGAREILGALWEVNEMDAYTIIERALRVQRGESLSAVIKGWLKDRLDDDEPSPELLDKPSPKLLYDIAAFRTLGRPYAVKPEVKHS